MKVDQTERRQSVLSEHDIDRIEAVLVERIETAFDKYIKRLFESNGYDISDARTRADIHMDHAFVRDLRKGTGKVRLAAFTMGVIALLALIGKWIVVGAVDAARGVLKVVQ